jgi:lipoic acid synthetase
MEGVIDLSQVRQAPKPPWIRVRLPSGREFNRIRKLKESKCLHTVCEEARCPNMGECWGRGNATFLLLGDVCTRDCRFCAVRTGKPAPVEADEPLRVAEAVGAMGLRHAVITSVTRDDLADGGASLFADTIRQVRRRIPGCTVEVLIPDFKGSRQALFKVVGAGPDIFGHNLETVPRLYPEVRPQAIYRRSLELIRTAKALKKGFLTKSGIMLGMGESVEEILKVMDDLRQVDCDVLTLGQYLSPSREHLPVHRYYTPREFESLKKEGEVRGFRWVESGPLVRSSYHAESQAAELLNRSG